MEKPIECDDAISRDAVLDTTICEGISCNECSFNEIDGESGCLLHARIDELPSVTQKSGKWITVSKRLPEAEYGESDSVLVCFENETQDVLYFDGSNWRYLTGEIYISVNHKNGWHNKVVAWMPLPKPYEPQESEEISEHNMKMWEEIFKAESEDKG